MCWIVGCSPASSVSSQCAPSKTGVAMNVDGAVVGRVFDSVPRIGSAPTELPLPVGPAPAGAVAEVGLEHLADVHPARHAERVEDDVDGRAVGEERHVLDREDLGDDALVAVAAGQLVADRDLALLGHVDPHQLVDAGRQLVAVVAVEHLDVDDLAVLAVGHLHRGVADLAGLLAEDRPQQALLGRQLGLALRRDLADQHVAGPDLGADADDPAVVEVGEDVVGEVRDVPARSPPARAWCRGRRPRARGCGSTSARRPSRAARRG